MVAGARTYWVFPRSSRDRAASAADGEGSDSETLGRLDDQVEVWRFSPPDRALAPVSPLAKKRPREEEQRARDERWHRFVGDGPATRGKFPSRVLQEWVEQGGVLDRCGDCIDGFLNERSQRSKWELDTTLRIVFEKRDRANRILLGRRRGSPRGSRALARRSRRARARPQDRHPGPPLRAGLLKTWHETRRQRDATLLSLPSRKPRKVTRRRSSLLRDGRQTTRQTTRREKPATSC